MAKTFIKLSRPSIRKLSAGERIMEHGICFERLANGDGLYSVNVMVDRKRIHRTVGRESEGTTRTTAEEYIAKLRRDTRDGRLNLPKRRKVPLSLAAAVPQYVERLEQEGGKDIGKKRKRLEHHVVPFLGDRSLADISTFDIERYKKHRLAQPIGTRKIFGKGEMAPLSKPATVNRELAALSHLLNKAVEWGWLDRSQAKIRRLKEDTPRLTYLTAEQAESLLEAAKRDQNPQIYPFVMIGLRTGMRKSEILGIRREHIDFASRNIHIPKAKAGARNQPISGDLADFLASYVSDLPPGCPWLFPSLAAATGHTTDIRKAFVRSVLAAGLDPKAVVRHTLRHTAITHLVQAGVDLPTVKRISGHKTLVMVERYAHQSGNHIAAALDRLDERLNMPGKQNAL